MKSVKNGCRWLPAALGETDPQGRPASSLGMPGRWHANPRYDRTELQADLRSDTTDTSRDTGVEVGRVRRVGGEEWVRFGAWNVRSLRGREEELIEEMVKYKLEVLGASETKVKGNGAKAVGDGMCVYSGVQEGRAKAGVAVFLSKEMSRCMREWKCVSERIVRVRLRIEGEWVTVIQVYAPTEDSKDEVKEGFYEQLQETVKEVQKRDKLIVMGDLNARVGNNAKVWREVIGKQGEVVENGNGKRLLQFCAENDMVVTNTWFQHKDIHKFTWECRGRNQRSIIDYFLVRREMRCQVRDVKVVRGAEIGSDHYLLLMVIKLKTKGQKPRERKTGGVSIRVEKLKDKEVRWMFEAKLRSKYFNRTARQIGGQTVEVAWNELKEGVLRSAVEVCGMSRKRSGRRRTAWWSKEVQDAVKAKKAAYKRLLNQGSEEAKLAYNEAKKEAKSRVKKAKNDEWIRLGEQMEKDAKGMQRRFWSRIRPKGMETATHIRGLDGELKSGAEALSRWREHFDNLLNGNAGQGTEEVGRDGTEGQVEEGEIEVEEVKRAVRKLKSGKAGGVCGIQVEMVKAGGFTMVQWLKEVFEVAWKCGKTPNEWREAIIVPIHKKGSRTECGNYRGISLLSVVGKIYARIVSDRLRVLTDSVIMDEQGGFRASRGCVDQVFVVKQVIEKVIEKDKIAYAAFIDLEKAYDSVSREKLWEALSDYGVRGKLLLAIQSLYEDGWARVRVGGRESSRFEVKKGVRQGCPMSPWLFNIFIDRIVTEARKHFYGSVQLTTGQMEVLLFADDLMLMAETEEALQHNLQELNDVLDKWGMKANWQKTKVMRIGRKQDVCNVEVNGEAVEQVKDMKYLGVMISGDGSMDREVEQRIGMASKMIGAIGSTVLGRKELSKGTKLRVVNAMVIPTLTYGCEAWALQTKHKGRIQATQMRVLRRIEGVTRLDRIRNVDIKGRLRQEGVVDIVRRRQQNWKQRLEEMDSDRVTKKVYDGEIPGKRPRGRPRRRWTDNFE